MTTASLTTQTDVKFSHQSIDSISKPDLQSEKEPWIFRWRRNSWAMHYYRWMLLVLSLNVGAFYGLDLLQLQVENLGVIYQMAVINFVIAILFRSQYTINALFAAATAAPTSWPLRIRWSLGKVYHFGGIAVGGFLSGTLLLCGFLLQSFLQSNMRDLTFSVFSQSVLGVHLATLFVVMAVSLPPFRHRFHNTFEVVARFGNWFSLLLFWVELFSLDQSLLPRPSGIQMIATWEFLALTFSTVLVALPWMKLKKVPVQYQRPSDHVTLASFDYGVTPFAGSSTDLSRSPLLEWHSFANVPSPDRDGFRLTISRAGDWTGQLNEDLPSHLWTKGIPAAGVGNIEKLFRKVVWVATGSGIGPCLPHLLKKEVPAKLVWSTRNPESTYGKELLDEVLGCEPTALIWNTDQDGKPDMVELALRAVKQSGAEAVICIANKKLTWKVVTGLEQRGIPAFGAIWDS